MSRRLAAITIDADDGRLTNVTRGIGRIDTCIAVTLDSTVIDFFGRESFNGKAACATRYKPPTYPDVLSGPDPSVPFLHDPAEVGREAFDAARSATGQYRTSPLRGIWQHPPYSHDGRFARGRQSLMMRCLS